MKRGNKITYKSLIRTKLNLHNECLINVINKLPPIPVVTREPFLPSTRPCYHSRAMHPLVMF